VDIPRAWNAKGSDLDVDLIDYREDRSVLYPRFDNPYAMPVAPLLYLKRGQRGREIEIGIGCGEKGVSY
jgi:hypothetical protein